YQYVPPSGCDTSPRPPNLHEGVDCRVAGQALIDVGGCKSGNMRTIDPSGSASERSRPCLRCHGNESALHDFAAGEHARADVGCTDCHDPHGGGGRLMLKAGDPLAEPMRGATWRAQETTGALCSRSHPAV